MTTALFLLRCTQLGLPMADLYVLDVGMIFDMFIESANDRFDYVEIATQDDFDKF